MSSINLGKPKLNACIALLGPGNEVNFVQSAMWFSAKKTDQLTPTTRTTMSVAGFAPDSTILRASVKQHSFAELASAEPLRRPWDQVTAAWALVEGT